MTHRRALAAAMLAAVSVLPVLAQPASAVRLGDGSDLLEAVIDTSTGARALAEVSATGTLTPFGDAGPTRDFSLVNGLTASASGDRVASKEFQGDRTQRVVVRDASGATVAVPETRRPDYGTQPHSYTTLGRGLALTADGDRVYWRREVRQVKAQSTGCGVVSSEIVTAAVPGGAVTSVLRSTGPQGYYDPVVLGDGLLVLARGTEGYADVDSCGTTEAAVADYVTVAADGSVAPVSGLAVQRPASGALGSIEFEDLAFSPDGGRVAYVRSAGRPDDRVTRTVETAPVTRQGNLLSIGTGTALGEGSSPVFTRDGSAVVFEAANGVVSAPSLGGALTVVRPANASVRGQEVAVLQRESTSPTAPTRATAVRTGASARVTVELAADPTASRVRVTRTSPGLPPATFEAVLPATSVSVPVVNGRAYTLAVQVIDRSGNVGPAITRTLPASAPPAAVRTSGQQLNAGQQLRAANGVRFRVGTDGNLVSYAPSGRVMWQARTRATGAVLRVQNDGNLVLRDSTGRVRFQTGTAGRGSSVLTVQGDGNLVLYADSTGAPTWSTRTGRLAG